jgi:predicted alpha/beta superfamily hydrolase
MRSHGLLTKEGARLFSRGRRSLVWGLCLLLVWPHLLWALPASPAQPGAAAPDTLAGEAAAWGTVTRHRDGRGPRVVHIQDLHCNYEAQMNIARLLALLTQKHGLRFIGLEGPAFPLDVAQLRDFPLPAIRDEIGETLVRSGEISGPEYFAATGGAGTRLVGLESAELYAADRRSLDGFLNAECQGVCLDLREALDALKPLRASDPPARRELARWVQRLEVMERVLNISATPADVAQVRGAPRGFAAQGFLDFLQAQSPGRGSELANELPGLDRALALALEFYRLADERSRELAGNLFTRLGAANEPVVVLVTGGYHTDAVLAELDRRGVAYDSFRPAVAHPDAYNPYFDRLHRRGAFLEKALAPRPTGFMPESNFPESGAPVSAADAARTTGFRRVLELLLKADAWARLQVFEQTELERSLDWGGGEVALQTAAAELFPGNVLTVPFAVPGQAPRLAVVWPAGTAAPLLPGEALETRALGARLNLAVVAGADLQSAVQKRLAQRPATLTFALRSLARSLGALLTTTPAAAALRRLQNQTARLRQAWSPAFYAWRLGLQARWGLGRAPLAGARKPVGEIRKPLDWWELGLLLQQVEAGTLVDRLTVPLDKKFELKIPTHRTIVYQAQGPFDPVRRILEERGGACHITDQRSGARYLFVLKDIPDQAEALEHEQVEMFWQDQITRTLHLPHTDPLPPGFTIDRAAHVLAWATQIALRGWTRVEDSLYLSDQLQRIGSQHQLELLQHEDRSLHRQVQNRFLGPFLTQEQLANLASFELTVQRRAQDLGETQTLVQEDEAQQPPAFTPGQVRNQDYRYVGLNAPIVQVESNRPIIVRVASGPGWVQASKPQAGAEAEVVEIPLVRVAEGRWEALLTDPALTAFIIKRPDTAHPDGFTYEGCGPQRDQKILLVRTPALYQGHLEQFQLREKESGKLRTVKAYLPPSYGQDPQRRYPVTYLLDGQTVFSDNLVVTRRNNEERPTTGWKMHQAAEEEVAAGNMEERILIAVHSDGDRMDEYCPWFDADRGEGGGGEEEGLLARRHARFLTGQLKDAIDERYPTRPGREHTAVIGASFGGEMAIYLGLEYPQIYSRVGAMAPSIYWSQGRILQRIRQTPHRVHFYLDVGRGEFPDVPSRFEYVNLAAWELEITGIPVDYFNPDDPRHEDAAWTDRRHLVTAAVHGRNPHPGAEAMRTRLPEFMRFTPKAARAIKDRLAQNESEFHWRMSPDRVEAISGQGLPGLVRNLPTIFNLPNADRVLLYHAGGDDLFSYLDYVLSPVPELAGLRSEVARLRALAAAMVDPVEKRRLNVVSLHLLQIVFKNLDALAPDAQRAAPVTLTLKGKQPGRVHNQISVWDSQLRKSRPVVVYTPPGYDADPGRHYPVVYMFDGQNLFRGDPHPSQSNAKWNADEAFNRLIASGEIEGAIVVGVYADPMLRHNEYPPFFESGRGGGGGVAMTEFMIRDLKPLIDNSFRTQPTREHTSLIGSSFGGLLALFAGLRHPEVYSRLGAVSPSFYYSKGAILDTILEYWQQFGGNPAALMAVYTDMGDAEHLPIPQSIPTREEYTRIVAFMLRAAGLGAEYHGIPGGTHHESSWAQRIQNILRRIFGSSAIRTPSAAQPLVPVFFPPGAAEAVRRGLERQDATFVWKENHAVEIPERAPGLRGLLQVWNELRSGETARAQRVLAFEAQGGYLFAYIDYVLAAIPELAAFRTEINRLSHQASIASEPLEKQRLNQAALWLCGRMLDELDALDAKPALPGTGRRGLASASLPLLSKTADNPQANRNWLYQIPGLGFARWLALPRLPALPAGFWQRPWLRLGEAWPAWAQGAAQRFWLAVNPEAFWSGVVAPRLSAAQARALHADARVASAFRRLSRLPTAANRAVFLSAVLFSLQFQAGLNPGNAESRAEVVVNAFETLVAQSPWLQTAPPLTLAARAPGAGAAGRVAHPAPLTSAALGLYGDLLNLLGWDASPLLPPRRSAPRSQDQAS